MSALSTNRVRWGYLADDGTNYRISALKELVDQNVVGGSDPGLSAPVKPIGMRMRRIYVLSGTTIRSVPSYDTTNTAWTAGTGTVNIDLDNVSTIFAFSADKLKERNPRRSGAKSTS